MCCPHCGSDHVTYLERLISGNATRRMISRISLKTAPTLEDSPIVLDKWLTAVWLIVNRKSGISSYEVHRALGITQKSAWFMVHRIRFTLHSGSFEKLLSGECEPDETFISGKARNTHKGKRVERITRTGTKDKAAGWESYLGCSHWQGIVRTNEYLLRRSANGRGAENEVLTVQCAVYAANYAPSILSSNEFTVSLMIGRTSSRFMIFPYPTPWPECKIGLHHSAFLELGFDQICASAKAK